MRHHRPAFGMHLQLVWQERSGDTRLPYWLRVAALAFGTHKANGHAPFQAGQIGLVLGTVEPVTGEVIPLNKHNVQRAIRKAVEYGWLAPESSALCLVVPGDAVHGGYGGRSDAKCPHHSRKRSGVGQ